MNPLMYATTAGAIDAIPIEGYPDGTPLVRSERLNLNWGVRRMLLRPSSLGEFMAAMFFVDALADRGHPVPELILPIMPGGRQDRLNPTGDYLFTAKSVAHELNLRRFPSITLLDPHSDVTPALVERSRVMRAVDCINAPAGKYAAVISPDAGAEKRAAAVAKKLGVPLVHAWKTRDLATGGITGFGMEPCEYLTGELVLVVDDLCDAGGTFIGLSNVFRDRRMRAHLWTTHGLYSRGTSELLERYGHLYCTDSVAGPRDGVIEVNVCERLLKGTLS